MEDHQVMGENRQDLVVVEVKVMVQKLKQITKEQLNSLNLQKITKKRENSKKQEKDILRHKSFYLNQTIKNLTNQIL